jgi:hypothetical protein
MSRSVQIGLCRCSAIPLLLAGLTALWLPACSLKRVAVHVIGDALASGGGVKLFLASYGFDKPLIRVYRYAVPFFIVLLVVVLLITSLLALMIGVRALGAWSS